MAEDVGNPARRKFGFGSKLAIVNVDLQQAYTRIDRFATAVWVAPNLEYHEIDPPAHPRCKPWARPHPDVVGYAHRDHANRVSHWRPAEEGTRSGTAMCIPAPRLSDRPAAPDRRVRARAGARRRRRPSVERATGTRPRDWLSIARSESWHAPELLREAGLTYACDWVNDEQPRRFADGLVNLPLNHELGERQIIAVQQQSADSDAEQIRDAFDWLAGEAAAQGGGRLLPLHVTPYIVALPYRIAAFEALLADLAARREAWFAPGGAIVGIFEETS